MKWVCVIALCALAAAEPDALADVADIRTLEGKGQWGDAADRWAEEAKANPEQHVFRAWLLALQASGRHREFHEVAANLRGAMPSWEEPAVLRAQNWVRQGKLEDAANILAGLNSLESRSVLGRVFSLQGKAPEALQEFNAVVSRYGDLAAAGPRDHLAAGWAYRGLGNFHQAARAMETAYQDSLDYLPARLALAQLFHEKYQTNLAKDELQGARQLSPQHPDIYLVAAEISVQNHNFVVARNMLEQAEALAGASRISKLLWIHMDLVAELWNTAEESLAQVLDQNPRDSRALALWAAQAYMQRDEAAFAERTQRLQEVTGSPIEAYIVAADLLELAIRTQEAIDMYRRVVEFDPSHSAAWASLGLLSMRMGREEEARGYLEKGFELDQFNVRAYNQLELLDFMDRFSEYDFGTFSLRLLSEADSSLVDLMAEEMKTIRAELIERLDWEPRNPTIIEVFPSHDWFSSRITGLAWIDGIPGVCFGDVLAMDSPRYLAGRSNWREILKHEFGHVMALDMTDRKVPFWFTEGLSVYLEDVPPPKSWDENLLAAAWDGQLVPIDSLTIAFTRPSSRFQRLLAYHQASLVIREIVEVYGWDTIPRLLGAFGQGHDLKTAVQDVLDLEWSAFQSFTMEAVKQEAESMKIWPRPSSNRSELVLRENASPDRDRRELVALYMERRLESARNRCREILKERPRDATANGVLGLVLYSAGDYEEALHHLSVAQEEGSEDFEVWVGLGNTRLDLADSVGAADAFRVAHSLYPKDPEVPMRLARLAQVQGLPKEAADYYRLALAVDDELGPASVHLAHLEIEEGDPVQAAEALDYALGILPLSPEVHALRGRVKLLEDDDQEAYRLFREARALDLRNVEWMVGMAAYYMKQEDFEEALYFANLALKYEPKHPTARRIQAAAEAEI